jgi:hypothetical protein
MLIPWETMNEEIETTTPVEQVAAEQVQTVETTPEATTEQTQVEAQPEQKEKKTPWFEKRISEVTREKYEARRAAEEAMAEAQELREQLAKAQSGEQVETPQGDVKTLAKRMAQDLVAEQSFTEKCNKVYEAGVKEFPDFKDAVSNLQMVGVNREFLELTATSDAGAKLIHHLGNDLDEAARIASLPPLQMARELTKLELKLSQPQTKPVSSAPAPITPINGNKGGTKDPSEMTDAEFAAWRKSQIKARSG